MIKTYGGLFTLIWNNIVGWKDILITFKVNKDYSIWQIKSIVF